MSHFPRRFTPSPALVVAVVALVVAVAGSAAASGLTAPAAKKTTSHGRVVIRVGTGPATSGGLGTIAPAVASCHAGERAVGGGGEAYNGNWALTESRPEGANGQIPTNGTLPTKWSVTFGNYNGGASTVTVGAYVLCQTP